MSVIERAPIAIYIVDVDGNHGRTYVLTYIVRLFVLKKS